MVRNSQLFVMLRKADCVKNRMGPSRTLKEVIELAHVACAAAQAKRTRFVTYMMVQTNIVAGVCYVLSQKEVDH